MPSWNDFSSIWSTLRELDVSAIREEAERPLFLALLGQPAATEQVAGLLRANAERFPALGIDPLAFYTLPLSAASEAELRRADLLILALDARTPLSPDEQAASRRLAQFQQPLLSVVLYRQDGATATSLASLRGIQIADPDALTAGPELAEALLERLPAELHMAAARRLPGLRPTVAQNLVSQTAFSNATYSLASGLPEQIPFLSIPFAAADILVLTKNQALLVYKLALALGAPPDFQARIKEVLPVVGGAYLWRQVARSLIGLVPVWGLVPKVAVAYAGTYTTGIAAWRWYAKGELVSGSQLQRVTQEALRLGRARAGELIAQARQQANGARSGAAGAAGSLFSRLRRLLPGRAAPPQLQAGSPPEQKPPS